MYSTPIPRTYLFSEPFFVTSVFIYLVTWLDCFSQVYFPRVVKFLMSLFKGQLFWYPQQSPWDSHGFNWVFFDFLIISYLYKLSSLLLLHQLLCSIVPYRAPYAG